MFSLLSTEIFDELVCLVLRVYHEWPTSALEDNDAVFDGGGILGEAYIYIIKINCLHNLFTVYVPILDLDVFSQEGSHRDIRSMLNLDLIEILNPTTLQLYAVIGYKGTSI